MLYIDPLPDELGPVVATGWHIIFVPHLSGAATHTHTHTLAVSIT